MFKVTKTEYTNKTFRFPNDLLLKLEMLAQQKQVSLNQLVVQCCKYAMNNLEDTQKNNNNLGNSYE